jgi:hypothetical protein
VEFYLQSGREIRDSMEACDSMYGCMNPLEHHCVKCRVELYIYLHVSLIDKTATVTWKQRNHTKLSSIPSFTKHINIFIHSKPSKNHQRCFNLPQTTPTHVQCQSNQNIHSPLSVYSQPSVGIYWCYLDTSMVHHSSSFAVSLD